MIIKRCIQNFMRSFFKTTGHSLFIYFSFQISLLYCYLKILIKPQITFSGIITVIIKHICNLKVIYNKIFTCASFNETKKNNWALKYRKNFFNSKPPSLRIQKATIFQNIVVSAFWKQQHESFVCMVHIPAFSSCSELHSKILPLYHYRNL